MCDACAMRICAGLVGPKSGHVKNVWLKEFFFKVLREPETANQTNNGASRSGREGVGGG